MGSRVGVEVVLVVIGYERMQRRRRREEEGGGGGGWQVFLVVNLAEID